MSLNLFWFLPTTVMLDLLSWYRRGSRRLTTAICSRCTSGGRIGFTGVLIPTGHSCRSARLRSRVDDSVAAPQKFLVALRPSSFPDRCRTSGGNIGRSSPDGRAV